jgi:hypothetical protein
MTYHDEYGTSSMNNIVESSVAHTILQLHTCLKYKERSRSKFIGGPIQLQQ